jgi:hypothetical protein
MLSCMARIAPSHGGGKADRSWTYNTTDFAVNVRGNKALCPEISDRMSRSVLID